MKFINKINEFQSNGHYSLAVTHNDLVFVSGLLAINPATNEKQFGTIEEETLLVLEALELILQETGSSKNDVLKTTIYIPDISLWDSVNRIYSNFFGDHKPARAIVPTKNLHFDFKIEIEAVAAIKQKQI
ncbi:RidA family protein [Paenibacillus qinlingensis]|uniref:Reactive intermediate/imine deaminase n=1 Tax=Paenibacillus qinlingensis TaxID=1837343 RepID=A0ABU1NV99_9BACL|nr:RidA family protein [Paenibacillus qinlingensis]MDR6551403.1 reactive intermediate/imine deaminase [Paenibacillus qinlingensis]